VPKLAETNRLYAGGFVSASFDRAKPVSEGNRRFFERALRERDQIRGSNEQCQPKVFRARDADIGTAHSIQNQLDKTEEIYEAVRGCVQAGGGMKRSGAAAYAESGLIHKTAEWRKKWDF